MTFLFPLAPSNAVYSPAGTPDGNTLIKAHVSGYPRGDGTRVQPHERSTAAARAATGSATAAASRKQAAQQNLRSEIESSPIVAEVLRVFPGAKIVDIKNPEN